MEYLSSLCEGDCVRFCPQHEACDGWQSPIETAIAWLLGGDQVQAHRNMSTLVRRCQAVVFILELLRYA